MQPLVSAIIPSRPCPRREALTCALRVTLGGGPRCLASLAEWERLSVLVRKEWRRQESAAQREMAPLAAHAAWHMGHWDEMGTFVDALKALEKPATSEVAFLEAVLHVRQDDHAAAKGAAAPGPAAPSVGSASAAPSALLLSCHPLTAAMRVQPVWSQSQGCIHHHSTMPARP